MSSLYVSVVGGVISIPLKLGTIPLLSDEHAFTYLSFSSSGPELAEILPAALFHL